jgi:L-2-hydroxyglutarate oxidase LhgO
MDEVNVAIIGAGVVGLAIARELSGELDDVIVLERHDGIGLETSSRNSEVIHAGIYYPPGSVKATTCVEGSRLLYEYCRENSIPHRKTGKLIVAVEGSEEARLELLFENGKENGVEELNILHKEDVNRLEPSVIANAAITSPETGIIDVHSLMNTLHRESLRSGAVFSFNTEVDLIERGREGYTIGVRGESYRFMARTVINSAGLSSDRIASLAGIDIDRHGYRLGLRKGSYFSYQKVFPLGTLVYPMPPEGKKGLGVHATLNLEGRLRFGPDSERVDRIDYRVDPGRLGEFFASASRYLRGLERENFSPDMAGIRPSLEGDVFGDFIIRHENDKGLPGLINLVGIDSPGLSASLSIARYVKSLCKDIV